MNIKTSLLGNKIFFVWVCIIPAMIAFTLFCFYPIVNSAVGSAFDWNALSGQLKFVGIKNYKDLLADEIIPKSFINTFYLTFWAVLIKTVFGFLAALCVGQVVKGKGFYRTVYFIPTVCTMVATSFMFRLLFQPEAGVVNSVLSFLHIYAPGWLEDPKWAMNTVILYTSWKDFGYVFLIFLAGLQGIPKDLMEAATIDGASTFKRMWNIILPLLKPITVYNIVSQVIGSLQIFTSIMIMTNNPRSTMMGGPMNATTTTGLYIYQKAFLDYNFGYASAIAVVLFVVIMLFTVIQLKFSKTDWGY